MQKPERLYGHNVFISFILLILCSHAFATVTLLDNRYNLEIYATYPATENPRSLVFDNDANLYCTHTISGTIRKITPDRSSSDFVTGLNSPKGIVWAGGTAYGQFFYVSTTNGMDKISHDGRSTTTNWCTDSDGLNIPIIDTIGDYDYQMYVTTTGADNIKKITTTGSSSEFYDLYWGPTANQKPQGLIIATDDFGGKMYVARFCLTEYPPCDIHKGIQLAETATRFSNLGRTFSLAIDKTGDFYDDMFAKSTGLIGAPDSVGIWRVKPNQTVEKFVDMNDVSPGDVIFGPDGAMYISELVNNDTVNIIRIFCIDKRPPIYVDDNAPADREPNVPDPNIGGTKSDPQEDGSYSNPFDSIQKAIKRAEDGRIIIVKNGVYTGIGNYDVNTNGLAVTITSENGYENTIIDCNNLGQGFIFTQHEKPDTIIDGFTITNGYADEFGGAVECISSSPTIKNCKVINNYAVFSGGAFFIGPDSNSVISNCEIYDNNAEISSGGGIYSYYSSPVIKNCVIAQNFAYCNGSISSNDFSDSIIENCTIADNFAKSLQNDVGGLMCFNNSHTKMINSIIWNNYGKQIFTGRGATIEVTYSDIEMFDSNGIWRPDRKFPGKGNINLDPLFVDPYYYDYHLMSQYGRWVPYATCNGDFNADGIIDYKDYNELAENWLGYHFKWLLYGDPKYKQVDYNYIWLLTLNWLVPNAGINTEGKEFVNDPATSPCIDAGDPNSDYSWEQQPNGRRINMDAYGNTPQASKSPDPDVPVDPND